jgi:lysyl-tRNA synthetase class 2
VNWEPSAAPSALRERAELLRSLRVFFEQRAVLEVETPLLASAPVTDPNIDAYSLKQAELYLQTSPEYAMKRLLAAGSGPIYQICKAFRRGEQGSRHNPEFSMLEWYRPGFSFEQLISEVAELLILVLGDRPIRRVSYGTLFKATFDLDIYRVSAGDLCSLSEQRHGIFAELLDRDSALDLLFSHDIEPRLGLDDYCFVDNFPASQAALAKLGEDEQGNTIARRFEVFINGIELANGYDELTDADEQAKRFERDCELRRSREQEVPPQDAKLLAAVSAGLPDCAGVALGLDRLLMLKVGASSLAEVLAFPIDRV